MWNKIRILILSSILISQNCFAASTVITVGEVNTVQGANRYNCIGGAQTPTSTTQAEKQTPIYSAGTFDKLKVNVRTNTADAATTVALQVDGSSVNCSVSISAAQTGLIETTTESDAITTTQKVNLIYTQAAGTGSLEVQHTSISFSATSNTSQLFILNSRPSFSDDTDTVIYFPLFGTPAGSGGGTQEPIEDNVEFTFKTGGTLRNASWYVSGNDRTDTTTLRSRVAGANGNISIAVTTTSTGLFQDTSNTDTISTGNTVDWSCTSGSIDATNNLTGTMAACEFITTDSSWENITGPTTVGGDPQSAATTAYNRISGVANTFTTIETRRQVEVPFALTASNLSIFVVTNLATTDGSLTLSNNASGTALTLIITALTSGLFVDDVNTVSTVADDLLTLKLITGDTSNTFIGSYGFKATTATAVTQKGRFLSIL